MAINLWKQAVRQCDQHGCGHFGAGRGKRTHSGIDIECEPNEAVLAPISGQVTKLGVVYASPLKSEYQYVQISVAGYDYRFMYILPLLSLNVGDYVVEGETIIGRVQRLGKFYEGITEHVHFEIKNPKGRRVDPTPVYLAKATV